MSTASISRSPYETAPPARREPAKARSMDEVFTLPATDKASEQDKASRPSSRVEQGRGSGEAAATEGGGAAREAAEATLPGGAEKPEGDDKAAGEVKVGTSRAEAGKQPGDAPAEKPVAAEKTLIGEEMIAVLPQPVTPVPAADAEKPAFEAALEVATQPPPDVIATTAETPEQPEAAKPTAGPSEIAAQFLALVAAAAPEPGAAVETEGGATKETTAVPAGKAEATGAPPVNVVIAPVPATPGKVAGETGAGSEAVTGEAKAGPKPAVAGVVLPMEPAKTDSETGEQAAAEPAGTGASVEGKIPERPAHAGQASQVSDGSRPDAPQQAAPAAVQAAPAAGPQALARPEPPLAPLDAAAQANAQAQAEANARAPVETTRPTPLHVVPVEIGARALAGNKRFDIRLDPAELGRVDVRLEISDDGSVSAKLTVDRVETLHLLQRDARTLERAFEQAGLKPSEGGVEMSLRDSADQSSRQHRQEDEGARTRRTWIETTDEAAPVTEAAPLRRAARLGGVDLSI